jgi:proline iminopeptidase
MVHQFPFALFVGLALAVVSQHSHGAESQELTPREGFLQVQGGPVWYRIFGRGSETPLLIVHGGPGARSCTFDPLAEILSRDRPVIVYDQLGTGRSGRPMDRSLWTVDRFVTELGEVRKALGLERVHLFGHSWGAGLVVSYLDKATPAGVESVILGGIFVSTRIWIEDANILLAQLPQDTQAVLKRHEAAGTTDSKEYQEAVEVFYSRYYYHKPKPPLPASCGESRRNDEIYKYMWGPNEFRSTGTLQDFDVTAALPHLKTPVLVTVGRFDEARPETAARLAEMIPKGRLEIIENCGHMAPLEDPEGSARVIAKFIKGL